MFGMVNTLIVVPEGGRRRDRAALLAYPVGGPRSPRRGRPLTAIDRPPVPRTSPAMTRYC